MPLVICDKNGKIQYKNDMAKEMSLLRVGSGIYQQMDSGNRRMFAELTDDGTILGIQGKLEWYRALVFPFLQEGERKFAFCFPEGLLGRNFDQNTEQALLLLVPALRKMMIDPHPLSPVLGKSESKKSGDVRMVTLMRKMMDLYLSEQEKNEEVPVDIYYFISVLTYYYRNVYHRMGVEIAVSKEVSDCSFLFYEHRQLTLIFLSIIALLVDRTGSDRLYMDMDSEGRAVVVKFSAILRSGWIMPDHELPDAFVLFALLKRFGIDYEFYNEIENESARMICRLYLPVRMACPILGVRSQPKTDFDFAVMDFLSYLEG
jgi:hypothetical protein